MDSNPYVLVPDLPLQRKINTTTADLSGRAPTPADLVVLYLTNWFPSRFYLKFSLGL